MKTLVFYGSPKKNGHTRQLLDALLENLEGEVKEIDCYHADVAPCRDCKFCFRKKGCSIQDDMQKIYEEIDTADAVILATPMHFGIISAPMYTIFTRLQTYWSNTYIRKEDADKPRSKVGALLVTSGGKWMNMELLMDGVVRFAMDHMEAQWIGSIYAKQTDTHPIDEETRKKARLLAQELTKKANSPF